MRLDARRDAVDAHRPGDVLELLLAHIVEGDRQLFADLLAHRRADADPARLGEPLSRAATLTPSPKMSPPSTMMSPTLMPMRKSMRPLVGHVRRCARPSPLHLDGAAHRIDDAGELDQHAVAGGLDDAAAVLARSCGSMSSRRWPLAQRACLPRPRPSDASSRRLGREDRRQPALDPLFAQVYLPVDAASSADRLSGNEFAPSRELDQPLAIGSARSRVRRMAVSQSRYRT